MKIAVLDKLSLGEDTPFKVLDEIGEVKYYSATTPENAVANIGDSDVVILNKVKITDAILEKCTNLKLVCVFATGYDNIDIVSARKHGVAVCNVPGYSTESVTVFTLATVLSLITHLKEYNDYVRSGAYTESKLPNKITPVFHELTGKTWGIIGCGNIGKSVLKIAEAFGARVIVNKRSASFEFECVDIETLCRESDIITVHCPLNDETRELINKERISLMKKSVILVNEARGAVLNEKDVAEAVLAGNIGGFGCDVYSVEPFGIDHPYQKIKDLDNVVLTPHSAWGAYEARERCINIIADNIKSYISGGTLNRVDL